MTSDIAHAAPSNTPGFLASCGFFYHHHQVSQLLAKEIPAPWALGSTKRTIQIGLGIGSFPFRLAL
ncbi:MAG: hypothetical protein VKI42_02300 [Synechococcaceae cyanobacterium]|nr:hypothetical protein [Synechococcaceae cyanobacterium]